MDSLPFPAGPPATPAATTATLPALHRWATQHALHIGQPHGVRDALAALVAQGLDQLPLPGLVPGATLARWRRFAEVAGVDLSLAKLMESHTDALAILAELGTTAPTGARLGVWAAEPPTARVDFHPTAYGDWRLAGRKAWCSAAHGLTHALVSGWNPAGQHCLALVALDQGGVTRTGEGWHAVGMAATASTDVRFQGALGSRVGAPGAYTARPGFWHGAAGIAVCWYGAAAAIAETLRQEAARRPHAVGPHGHAQLGRADAALHAARALLRETATAIDTAPTRPHHLAVQRVRAVVETAAGTVIDAVGRALGATPFCRDPDFARRLADLPVFLRQSHAERDLEAIGGQVAVTARIVVPAPPAPKPVASVVVVPAGGDSRAGKPATGTAAAPVLAAAMAGTATVTGTVTAAGPADATSPPTPLAQSRPSPIPPVSLTSATLNHAVVAEQPATVAAVTAPAPKPRATEPPPPPPPPAIVIAAVDPTAIWGL